MSATNSNKQGLGIDRVVLRHPAATPDNRWQVEILKSRGARGCYDALNASFAPHHQQVAENYAYRMMRILRTDQLERVA